MQQLEYWEGRPEYAGLPPDESETKQIEGGTT
jgi:hypothetical protein